MVRSEGWGVRWLASAFGAGWSPKAPGTVGSLVGLLVALPVYSLFPSLFPWLALSLLFLAILVCNRAVVEEKEADPSWIVLDEIVGIWVAMVGAPLEWPVLLIGFLLFRLFDIWKPWPARAAEKLPAGFGIVLDDVIAGLYTALILNFFF